MAAGRVAGPGGADGGGTGWVRKMGSLGAAHAVRQLPWPAGCEVRPTAAPRAEQGARTCMPPSPLSISNVRVGAPFTFLVSLTCTGGEPDT